KRITVEQADAKHPVNPDDPFHTFFFSLSSGKIIDGGEKGNDARWINHSCGPNCEAQENASGKKVYIVALHDIPAGDELFYDYGLIMEGRITKTLRRQYQCLCGKKECRGTMLALPKKKPAKTKKDETPKKEKPRSSKSCRLSRRRTAAILLPAQVQPEQVGQGGGSGRERHMLQAQYSQH